MTSPNWIEWICLGFDFRVAPDRYVDSTAQRQHAEVSVTQRFLGRHRKSKFVSHSSEVPTLDPTTSFFGCLWEHPSPWYPPSLWIDASEGLFVNRMSMIVRNRLAGAVLDDRLRRG
jgi:hypothetical protein